MERGKLRGGSHQLPHISSHVLSYYQYSYPFPLCMKMHLAADWQQLLLSPANAPSPTCLPNPSHAPILAAQPCGMLQMKSSIRPRYVYA